MSKKVVLGQPVFVLSDGDVVRTVVAGIGSHEDYAFLNGYFSHNPHWFSFDEAIGAARERLEVRRAKLRKALRQLAAKDRELQSDSYRSGVENAPYKMTDLGYGDTKRFRPRMRKKVSVPETYLEPGQRVYAIITPATLPRLSDGWNVYRPYKHFILETYVKSVCLSPDGTVRYGFTTPLKPEEFFLSCEKAETELRRLSERGTLEEIHFVSNAQETEELAKIDDIPF